MDNKKFTFVKLSFDKLRDRREVDQFAAIDLRKAFVSGVVPGNIEVNAEQYNGVEDPGSLLGRSSDVFEQIRKGQYVESVAPAVGEPEGSTTSSAGNE